MKEIGVALLFIVVLLFFANYADNQPHEDFEDDHEDDPT